MSSEAKSSRSGNSEKRSNRLKQIVGQEGKGASHGHDHDHSHGEQGACGPVQVHVAEPQYAIGTRKYRGNAAVVTLGCAKNQVDSEVMVGVLKNSGYQMVADVSQADVAIVNTCGFLQSAVKESIDTILDVSTLKQKGRLRKLIVAGCLLGRYGDEVKTQLPEVDSFVSIDDILKVGEIADSSMQSVLDLSARPYFVYDDSSPRVVSTGPHSAYVKISEGCNRPCTFCIIPKIRGAMRSRTQASVVEEVRNLGQQGIREINLVAQDLTAYGSDLKNDGLVGLLRALDATEAVSWLRLLYAYPIGIDEELLRTIVELPRVCNYLDLPLQHVSERVLKEMKRPLGRFSPRNIVEFIRTTTPEIALRTTFIVGFPGETEQDIDELEGFILEGHFLNLGVFTYSREEGTPSHDMGAQISEKEKKLRRERLMVAQQKALKKRLRECIGKSFEALIDARGDTHPEGSGAGKQGSALYVARTRFQAPEVDGVTLITRVKGEKDLPLGTIGTVQVKSVQGYDLVGTFSLPSSESDRDSVENPVERDFPVTPGEVLP